MGLLKLFTEKIADYYVRQNFDRIVEYVRLDPLRKGNFSFMEVDFAGTGFPKKVTVFHRLNFQPKDIISLSVLGPDTATLTWHYDEFNRDTIAVTPSAECTARFYVGRYGES